MGLLPGYARLSEVFGISSFGAIECCELRPDVPAPVAAKKVQHHEQPKGGKGNRPQWVARAGQGRYKQAEPCREGQGGAPIKEQCFEDGSHELRQLVPEPSAELEP